MYHRNPLTTRRIDGAPLTIHGVVSPTSLSLKKKSRILTKRPIAMIFVVLVVSLSTIFLHCSIDQSAKALMMKRGSVSVNSTIPLRLDWTSLAPKSPLAKRLADHQQDCSLPLGNFKFRNRFGLGSDLHVWSQAVCNAIENSVRIRTVFDWLWMDQTACTKSSIQSPISCYFPKAELNCPQDSAFVQDHPMFDHTLFNLSHGPRLGTVTLNCPSILKDHSLQTMERAGIEFLFGQISPIVMKEAERQHELVFSGKETPKDLITVHIRWGDKKREMKLLDISKYIQAVETLLTQRPRPTVNIFLATEDPQAVEQFIKASPAHWNIYLDHFFNELLPHRTDGEYNNVPKASLQNKGRMGTLTLASLLVGMEANEYVLTTVSNWSRLMNELRLAILDSRCNNCTKLIDLKPATF